jgi:hypothetical protein
MGHERRGGATCRRCGANAFGSGDPYTLWVPVVTDGGTEHRVVHLCRPCTRDFASARVRDDYLRLVVFG